MNGSFLDFLTVKKGHYALESGLHGDVWFDLEVAYIRPQLLRLFIDKLATWPMLVSVDTVTWT